MEPNYQIEHKMKIAHDFESEGKLLHAGQIYTSIINDNPDFADVHLNLANLFEKMRNIAPGIELLKNFLARYPEDNDIRIFLGQYLLRNSKWDEAIDILSYILPEEEPVVSFFVGYSYFMLEEYEASKLNFLNFLAYQERSELLNEAYIYLAKIELKLGSLENVLKYAKKAEMLYSNYWELNLIYAETYYKMDMIEHAVAQVEKAIKLNPKESATRELAGKIYLKAGDYTKAEKEFIKYIDSIDDVSSDIYTKLAEACLKSEKTKEAIAYYDIAIKIDPLNDRAVEGKKNASSLLKNNVVNDA